MGRVTRGTEERLPPSSRQELDDGFIPGCNAWIIPPRFVRSSGRSLEMAIHSPTIRRPFGRLASRVFEAAILATSVLGLAGDALATEGPVDELVASMKRGDARARSEAARSLGRMGARAREAVPALTE